MKINLTLVLTDLSSRWSAQSVLEQLPRIQHVSLDRRTDWQFVLGNQAYGFHVDCLLS